MKLIKAVKDCSNYVITKEGKILGINKLDGKFSNLEVKKIQTIDGLMKKLTCFRV